MSDPKRVSAMERAEWYLNHKLGGRKGFDLWLLVNGDEELRREVVSELAAEFQTAERAAYEQGQREMRERAVQEANGWSDGKASGKVLKALPIKPLDAKESDGD